jgi:hypothetical protein
MTGDVTYEIWNSCYSQDTSSGACTAGGAINYKGNITLNGTIDTANHTGAGKIK